MSTEAAGAATDAGNTAALTLLLEVGVAVGPSSRGGQVSGGRWGEVLCLVQAALFIGSEVASRAKHRAGCNARQLGTQKVGLCAGEWWIRRHLQTAGREGLFRVLGHFRVFYGIMNTDQKRTRGLSAGSLPAYRLPHASLCKALDSRAELRHLHRQGCWQGWL